MTCCILEKHINTVYIPGNPGQPGYPGTPEQPAYCSTSDQYQCGWFWKPGYSTGYECWDDNGVQKCAIFLYYLGKKIGLAGGLVYSVYTEYICKNVPVTTCYPATAAISPIPYTAPTPAQIITDYNLGWNSHSRAIDPLDVGKVVTFTVANGVHGAFVALGPSGVGGQNLASFGWGLMIDTTGVKVFENGVQVATLAASYNSTTAFRMGREFDGRLIYRAGLNEYTSGNPPPNSAVLYPYTYLYSGGDRLLCASYEDLNPEQTASSTMTGKGTLLVGAPSVNGTFNVAITMTGLGLLNVDEPYPYTITVSGQSALSAGVNTLQANITLPALEVLGADFAYSFVDTELPELDLVSSMAMYVPPTPTVMYATLPFLQAYGFIQTVEIDHSNLTLPEIQVVGGDYAYGFFNQQLPPLLVAGQEGERLKMEIISHLVTFSDFQSVASGVLILMSHGQIQSIQTFQVAVLMDLLSQMVAGSQWNVVGEFDLSLMSSLKAQSSQLLSGVTGAALNETARVWVVNMDTGASTQYDNYGFNSYFNRDGLAYGVADDGIYLLQGEEDAGKPIDAVIDMGITDFNSPRQKRLPAVYAAVAGNRLILKVEADGSDPYYYEMRSSSEYLDKHRFDLGRGLTGVQWSFSLLNQNGEDFELSSLEFTPVTMTRRI